jgi:protein-disulfide isomerase
MEMARRKEQKERARAERMAHEAELAHKRARDRRLKLIGASVAAAVLVVAIAIGVSQSGGKGGEAADIEGTSEVKKAFAGSPQRGLALGRASARVTINEFGDLQCPACKAFAETELEPLIDAVVRPGTAKLVFKNYNIIGPDSEEASKAALAASEQNRYWQFLELFYRNQGIENSGYVTDEFLEAVAKAAGVLDLAKWNRNRRSGKWTAQLDRVQSQAAKLGFNSTPSFQVVGPGGAMTPGANSAGAIEDAVQQVLLR